MLGAKAIQNKGLSALCREKKTTPSLSNSYDMGTLSQVSCASHWSSSLRPQATMAGGIKRIKRDSSFHAVCLIEWAPCSD